MERCDDDSIDFSAVVATSPVSSGREMAEVNRLGHAI